MAEKSEKNKKSVKPVEKKMVQSILLKHPEVTNNARHLFRNENGRTIVEDRVPRGDPDRKTVGQPFCQGDLTDADLRDLAKYATEIIDEGILRYDEKTAHEDALHRAIDQKDGGKYAGKVNAATYNLLIGHVGSKKSSTEKKANDESLKIESSKEPEEVQMSNLGELAKVAQFIASQTPDQRLILKAMIKEAADQNDPKRWQKTMDSIGIKAPKSKNASEEDENPGEDDAIKAEEAKKHDEDEKDHEKKETADEKKVEEKAVEDAKKEKKEKAEDNKEKADKKDDEKQDKDATSIANQLDSIAGELEQSGDYDLFKVAYQIDQVTDVLEGKKTATALESEPDEKYMKDAFNSTIRQKDKDEKYMESFATDKTREVFTAYTKRPYGIVK
jgi:hypothetical protein